MNDLEIEVNEMYIIIEHKSGAIVEFNRDTRTLNVTQDIDYAIFTRMIKALRRNLNKLTISEL